jgi:Holliday junction resolvase-like predicted endonuclease
MDATTFLRIERTSKLGRIGERLAEERLAAAGFEDVKNLNRGMNFPYADILARKNGQVFLIGVKSRNEFQANGAINPCYNAVLIRNDKKQLLERLGKTEAEITAILWDGVDEIAARWKAIPAWVTVAMRPERGTYSAHFDLVSRIRHRRSIPMNLADRKDYVQLAPVGTKDARVTADLLNRAA